MHSSKIGCILEVVKDTNTHNNKNLETMTTTIDCKTQEKQDQVFEFLAPDYNRGGEAKIKRITERVEPEINPFGEDGNFTSYTVEIEDLQMHDAVAIGKIIGND